jgi:predicted NBD/HSP70 family sugar kinase
MGPPCSASVKLRGGELRKNGDLERLDGRARVLTTLSRSGPLSRAEVARRTRLAPSTVSGLVTDLDADGYLVELDAPAPPLTAGRSGRPGRLLGLHPGAGAVVGIDFGKSHIRVASADLAHRVLGERSADMEPDASAAVHISVARRLVDELLDETAVPMEHVVGLGCGFPGPVQSGGSNDPSIDPTILPGWTGVSPVDALTKAFGVPARVGNDANLGALSEWMWGAAHGYQAAIYVKVSTGIGAGLILDGRLFTGAAGTAGEIGHLRLDAQGPRCRCGQRGCLETLASGPAILALARRGGAQGLVTVEDVVEAAPVDPDCRRALAESGAHLGTALANLCNVLNPERIVVGGAVAVAGDLILAPLRDALVEAALGPASEQLTVVAGSLGDRAELLGALALALRSSVPRSL